MRFYFIFNFDIDFNDLLLYIQIIANNFFNNVIDLTLNEVYYSFKIRDLINLLFIENLFIKIFDKFRLILKKEVDDIIIFVSIIIKIYYDLKYLSLYFKVKNEVFFKLYHDYFILNFINRKLF